LVGPANASTQRRFGELSGKNSERPADIWSNKALYPTRLRFASASRASADVEPTS
jgi:hypothetical protein